MKRLFLLFFFCLSVAVGALGAATPATAAESVETTEQLPQPSIGIASFLCNVFGYGCVISLYEEEEDDPGAELPPPRPGCRTCELLD